MKVAHNAPVHKHPAHPWVIASCIVFGIGILAAAAFWIKKCNLYQNYKKENNEEEKDDGVIGHERFYQERTRSKKKRSPRRTRSAAEFSGGALELARRRSQYTRSSSGDGRGETKKGSITNLLFRRSSSVQKHEYSALRLENGVARGNQEKHDGEFTNCDHFLSNTLRYDLQCHLGKIGSRPDKNWFIVKDKSLGADRLLSLIEIPSCSPIKPSVLTRETLLDLFRSLHHPYIHPILDVEFWEEGAAFITPLNDCGSLKDLIYGQSWKDPYDKKYIGRGEGLPYRQVQCLGRQILEALLFLHNRNFPKFYHLHSSNIIIQNGVARLAGLENTLLGLPPKPPGVNDSLAFGYILFEMTAGYELPTPPSPAHLQIELERTPKISDALSVIFENKKIPKIEELLRHELFRGVELRELHRTTGISYTAPSNVTELLEKVKGVYIPTPKSDVEMLEAINLEDSIEEELDLSDAENEMITVIIETR